METSAQAQKSLNWKNVLIGVVVGSVLIGGGVAVYLLLQPKPEEPSLVTTPKTTTTTSKPKPEPPKPKDETAGWRTYKDANYRFELNYPKEWFVANEVCPNDTDKNLIILDQGKATNCPAYGMGLEGSYTFAVVIYSPEFDLNEKIKGREGFVSFGETLTIGEVKAVKVWPVSQTFYGRIEIYLNHNGNGFELLFPNKDYKGGYDSVYDKILSTFGFD